MKKYIAVIDWMTDYKNGFDHIELEAKDLCGAMAEAEDIMESMEDKIYLMDIAEKSGKQYKCNGIPTVDYNVIMTNRHNGWSVRGKVDGTWKGCKLNGNTWYEIKTWFDMADEF